MVDDQTTEVGQVVFHWVQTRIFCILHITHAVLYVSEGSTNACKHANMQIVPGFLVMIIRVQIIVTC